MLRNISVENKSGLAVNMFGLLRNLVIDILADLHGWLDI